MAHRFQVLTTPEQWEVIRPITEACNRALPQAHSGVVVTEFNEANEVVSFLILQDATFAEMLWARDPNTNLRHIWNMALDFLRAVAGPTARRELVTMVDDTEQGEKIGSALEALGCEQLHWKLYRRSF